MPRVFLTILLICGGFSSLVLAHPMPDIPVRTYLGDDGSLEIRVEVDPRAFAANPEEFEYETKAKTDQTTPGAFQILVETANRFVANRVKFHLEPHGEQQPNFTWSYQKLGDAGPLQAADDSAVLVGSWLLKLPEGTSGYRIESIRLRETGALAMNVNFFNFRNEVKEERYAVLFPGESSFAWNLGK